MALRRPLRGVADGEVRAVLVSELSDVGQVPVLIQQIELPSRLDGIDDEQGRFEARRLQEYDPAA